MNAQTAAPRRQNRQNASQLYPLDTEIVEMVCERPPAAFGGSPPFKELDD